MPKNQYVSNQDVVSPDIGTLYTKIIKDIDSFRSRCNGTELAVPIKNYDDILSNIMISSNYQESRCHTFYRMMGFPVVSADGNKMYSPGFDPDLNRDIDRLKQNLDIANSLLGDTKLKEILNKRENYPKNSANAFQIKDDNASALAIASISPRPFDKQLKVGLQPLEVDQQSFEVPSRNTVSLYFDNVVSFSSNSVHILKPFIVDPRIELTVTPSGNRICAPFLIDKSKTQLVNSNYLRRPYIERVIRIRFSNTNVVLQPNDQPEINEFVNNLIQFIENNTEVLAPHLVEITGNTLQSLHKSEIMVFSKFLKIIEALVIELVQDIVDIEKIQSLINWKPICNSNGPEFGAELNSINPSDTINNKKIENDIRYQQTQKYLSETDFDLGVSKPDLGNFAFSNIDDVIFGSVKNASQFYDKQLGTLENRREELGRTANNLMKNIEIITGEFSGLGLLDIMAIQAAFWIIKPEALIGMLDDTAIERMKTNQDLQTNVSKLPINDALTEFEKKLSEIYILIQAFYAETLAGGLKNKQ